MALTVNTYNGTNGNWTDVNNWSQGTAPDTGEVIIIPKVGTDITLDTNLDASAKNFGGIVVQLGSNVTIGASGNPLKCAVDNSAATTFTGKVTHEGAKAFYLKAEHATLDINLVECNSDNQNLAMQVDDDATAQILRLRVRKGKVDTTTTITALPYIEVGRRDNPDGDANLLIDTHATNVVTRLVQNAGTVTTRREMTDVFVAGGFFITDGAEVVTNLYVGGGTVQANSTGLITRALVFAGLLDFTKTFKGKTVTTLRTLQPGQTRLHEGVQIDFDESQEGTVVFSSAGGAA